MTYSRRVWLLGALLGLAAPAAGQGLNGERSVADPPLAILRGAPAPTPPAHLHAEALVPAPAAPAAPGAPEVYLNLNIQYADSTISQSGDWRERPSAPAHLERNPIILYRAHNHRI